LKLKELATQASLSLSPTQVELGEQYISLVLKWNKTRNLVSRNSSKKDLIEYFVDSAILSKHLQPGKIVDLGSGAGFPGLCLAVMNPHTEINFVFESLKLISVCGFITARHSPGKPAPLPKSTIFPGCKCLLKIALSTKYSIKSFFEEFLDTKFLVLFHLSTKEIYCSPSSTCVGERDRLAWVANSFSFKFLLS
jgi:hypothetical protein